MAYLKINGNINVCICYLPFLFICTVMNGQKNSFLGKYYPNKKKVFIIISDKEYFI